MVMDSVAAKVVGGCCKVAMPTRVRVKWIEVK